MASVVLTEMVSGEAQVGWSGEIIITGVIRWVNGGCCLVAMMDGNAAGGEFCPWRKLKVFSKS